MSIKNFAIIDSTLREGEQFINTFFSTDMKVEIAHLLNQFGVEYIELTSPIASTQSHQDCCMIADLGLQSKVLTHIRCHPDDAKIAVDTGVDGVNVVIGTSPQLRQYSLNKSFDQIMELAHEVLTFLIAQDVEVRFSTEDSLRSDPRDLIKIYEMAATLGVDRVGIADTVGVGTPAQIYKLVRTLRKHINTDIEFHGHNDSGCAVANAYAALEAGATHIDTCILGIGERNGITPLGGLIARLYATDPKLVTKYTLSQLPVLDQRLAAIVGVEIPFNNYITGYSAFSHKAGIHTKAVLNNPSTYEVLKPEDFGLSRLINVAHRLTGWNAVRQRAQQLGLGLSEQQIKQATIKIKNLSDNQQLTLDDVDQMLHNMC